MQYHPRQVAHRDWSAVRGFATHAVRIAQPGTVRHARNLLSTLARFLIWATVDMQLPLDQEELFHPALLARFASRARTAETRSHVEQRLDTIALALNGTPFARRMKPGPRSARPYSVEQMRELTSWADTLKTENARRNAGVLLALSGGAGLRSEEAMHTRVEDVHFTADGPVIRVHQHPQRPERLVAVRDDLAHYLDVINEQNPNSWALFPRRTSSTSREFLADHFPKHHTPAPGPNRLRDTWLLDVLHRLPLADVMHAAGIEDARQFTRFHTFLLRRPDTDLFAALRGSNAKESTR